MRACGKGCMYSVIVSFGVIASLSFPISIVKGIFGAYATLTHSSIHPVPANNIRTTSDARDAPTKSYFFAK